MLIMWVKSIGDGLVCGVQYALDDRVFDRFEAWFDDGCNCVGDGTNDGVGDGTVGVNEFDLEGIDDGVDNGFDLDVGDVFHANVDVGVDDGADSCAGDVSDVFC